MVVYYTIAGRQFGSHVLAMATLGTMATIGLVSQAGGAKKTKDSTPPINATNADEETFIRDFLKNAEADDKRAKH
ncbi:MAG: hypothetical protein M1829_002499 [Trizodia sp. TS-e1964]|nr:MAG: hypothetical protein M1829_002499 [Trizodia sp. TS-e1964]